MKRVCLSTMYGVGLTRIGPGTAGSFVAMLIAYPILLQPFGYAWLTLGALIAITSFRQWRSNERAMRQRRPLPSSPMSAVLSIGISVIAVIAIVLAIRGSK